MNRRDFITATGVLLVTQTGTQQAMASLRSNQTSVIAVYDSRFPASQQHAAHLAQSDGAVCFDIGFDPVMTWYQSLGSAVSKAGTVTGLTTGADYHLMQQLVREQHHDGKARWHIAQHFAQKYHSSDRLGHWLLSRR